MEKTAFITMDVESFYDTSCVKAKFPCENQNQNFSCAEEILNFAELLQKYDCKATFFITGTFIDEIKKYFPALIRSKNEISLHCYKHVSPLTQNLDEFDEELKKACNLIKENSGVFPAGYRAPCFGIDDERLKIVRQNQMKYDSSFMDTSLSVYNGRINMDGYKKINDSVYEKNGFYECVPSVVKFLGIKYPVSGGAYLRIPPYFFVKILLKKYLKNADSYLFYVHPFEISKKRLPLSKKFNLAEILYINRGRRRYLKRIEKIFILLKKYGYTFYTIGDFAEKIKNPEEKNV